MFGRGKHGRGFSEAIRNAKHPGFAGAEKSIEAKEGLSKQSAGAILAAGARKASPAAKKKNPNLKRVKSASRSKLANLAHKVY